MAAGQELAVASAHVERAFRVKRSELITVEGRSALALPGGAPVPVTSLAAVLGLTAAADADPERLVGIVLAVPNGRWAFATDALLSGQELVIKSLGARLRRLPHLSGAAVLGSGRIALVLNPTTLVAAAAGVRGDAGLAPDAGKAVGRKRILVADDSITIRSLERGILEGAGYEVLVASDGQAALALLAEATVDLLVSDVEMPRMDGYELTRAVRASPRLARLPVILLTGLDTPADKQRGIEAGADAYLVKSSFDQASLLETIAQLL
jgi:two-component system chemotaxis sensor kinase CheA